MTLLAGFEPYGLNAKALATKLQSKGSLGCNATVQVSECKDGVSKAELMLSGFWDKSLALALSELCGVPAEFVQSTAKKGMCEKVAKKGGKNIVR